ATTTERPSSAGARSATVAPAPEPWPDDDWTSGAETEETTAGSAGPDATVALRAPAELGRSVVVAPGSDPPEPWRTARRIAVDPTDPESVRVAIDTLEPLWLGRSPYVGPRLRCRRDVGGVVGGVLGAAGPDLGHRLVPTPAAAAVDHRSIMTDGGDSARRAVAGRSGADPLLSDQMLDPEGGIR
ncbi:MAG: hypothetical protein AAGK32_04115, partial [Actinomycetota bacterium]